DQTLAGGVAMLTVGTDGVIEVQAGGNTGSVTTCNAAACQPGELRCEGADLLTCNAGQTGFEAVATCASAALCQVSLAGKAVAGAPACAEPACTSGEYECTEAGVLQACNEDRTGFRVVAACIGPPFCDASLGEAGCTDAPCEAGVQ